MFLTLIEFMGIKNFGDIEPAYEDLKIGIKQRILTLERKIYNLKKSKQSIKDKWFSGLRSVKDNFLDIGDSPKIQKQLLEIWEMAFYLLRLNVIDLEILQRTYEENMIIDVHENNLGELNGTLLNHGNN